VLAACGRGQDQIPVASGQGSVTGSAVNASFDFAAAQVTALLDPVSTPNALVLQLCEFGCQPEGTQIQQDSRAVSVTVRADRSDLHDAANFPIGTSLQALAISRVFDSIGKQYVEKVDLAAAGRIAFEKLEPQVDGQVRGTFEFSLQRGGALHGFFEAPMRLTAPIPAQ
jgi:hypothetical protein